jgi:hypothetical protein
MTGLQKLEAKHERKRLLGRVTCKYVIDIKIRVTPKIM